jgi:hypothetical protein
MLAQGLEYSLNPLSHDPGGHHIISVRLIALLSGCDEQTIWDWAKTEEYYIRLEWTFPGSSYPKFTTRHALNQGATIPPEAVSFSGGLGWAQKMWQATEKLGFTNPPAQGHSGPYMWDPASRYHGLKMPLQSAPFTNWPNWTSSPGILTDPSSLFYGHGQGPDEPLDFMDGGSEETPSDTGTSHAFSDLGDNMEEPYATRNASIGDDSADGLLVQQQLETEFLQRQRMDAEVQYALNGDTSGMLAVLASASQSSGCWDSSGMPRF